MLDLPELKTSRTACMDRCERGEVRVGLRVVVVVVVVMMMMMTTIMIINI